MPESDLGLIGLGVMGRNLALNAENHGLTVSVYNRTAERTREFVAGLTSERIQATFTPAAFAESLRRPRKVLLMVKAGPPTDATLAELLPTLSPGDVVIDGGNAHYEETERREAEAWEVGVHYLGAGVSGGARGARLGPSIMPGGSPEAYAIAGPILESIAATGPRGTCCTYLGPGSAGHYVKMVHNGIEYAILQALAESYDVMKRGLHMSATEMADRFAAWNRGDLASYLVEITERILRTIDSESGEPLVERILDTASQKGTGKWSTQSALDVGAPSPTIAAAVFARIASALKGERALAGRLLEGPEPSLADDPAAMLADLYSALLLTTVVAYAQGFRQLHEASEGRGYGLDLADVARIWMAGCIIRSKLLVPIFEVFRSSADAPLLLIAEPFRSMWNEHQEPFRRLVRSAHEAGIPVPSMSSALDFADAYRTGRLPASLIQAQRDYFGAHTYRRTDREGDFHTEWEDDR